MFSFYELRSVAVSGGVIPYRLPQLRIIVFRSAARPISSVPSPVPTQVSTISER